MRIFAVALLPALLAAQTTYPAAVDTDASLLVQANRATTTLNASLNSTATSFTVTSASRFVTNMVISIEDEILKVCNIVGNTITVGHSACPNIDGRGFDGSSAASHANGRTVAGYVTKAHHNNLKDAVKAVQTLIGKNGENIANYTAAFPITSVKTTYGCVGDGSTDDTTCFTNAVAGGNKMVYIPEGTYIVNGAVALESNTAVVCASPETTVLKFKTGTTMTNLFTSSGTTNIGIYGCSINGNYPNAAGTRSVGVLMSGVKKFDIVGNRFYYIGYPQAPAFYAVGFDGYYETHSIVVVSSQDGRISRNRYNSNFGIDVQIQTSSGIAISEEQMGVPLLAGANTNASWWDTQSGAPGGYYVGTSSDVSITNCHIYGGMRFSGVSTPVGNEYGKGGPIRFVNVVRGVIANNVVRGLTPGFGTLTVTQADAKISGSNTLFSTLDPVTYPTNSDKNNILIVEGDTTEYKIDTVASNTAITLTTTMNRVSGSGLRYWIATSGDLIGCSPCQYVTIANNTGDYSGDMGLSLGKDAIVGLYGFNHNAITGNVMNKNRICGTVLENLSLYNNFTGNVMTNNHQIGSALTTFWRGAYCLYSPSEVIGYNTFANNTAFDDQGSPTQTYVFDIDPGSVANMTGNTLGSVNHNVTLSNLVVDYLQTVFSHQPQLGTFSYQGNMRSIGTTFSGLGTPSNGSLIYCSDCKPTSSVSNTCANGGSGAYAARINGAWKCFTTQSDASTGTTFASLGTPSNGVFTYCSDCAQTSSMDNTCTNLGSGAYAFRLNGAWRCMTTQTSPSTGVAFASLGTPADGSQTYCSDCKAASATSNVCAGSGTGAWAVRLNGAWRCRVDETQPSTGTLFAALGTPSNGTQTYCSDCTVTSEIDNTCAGSGSGAWATRLNGAWRCGSTQSTGKLPAYNAAGTLQTAAHVVFGKCTLGTDCAVTLSGAAAFSGTTSYYCAATDQTSAAAVKVVNTAGGTVTFTGTGTDVISYVCVGN